MSFHLTGCDPCSTVSQAARMGSLEEMERLIKDGHPIDAHDNRGWKPLHEAVAGNYIPCVQSLLSIENIDVNAQSFEGVTPLMLACQNNFAECAEILLKAQGNPDIADHMDNYPLHEAVKAGNLTLVKMLVEHGCNINCQLYCGTSPLHTCVAEGMLEITKYLLQEGASLETKEEYDITPIFTAAQFGQAECLTHMLKHAAEIGKAKLINFPAEDGATPLFLASQEGHLECVNILLEHGADANLMTKTEPKSLPVQAALEFGHLKVVSSLLPVTNQELFKECDCSPWYTVLTLGEHQIKKQAVQIMISHGVDVNYKHTKDMEETYTRFPKILRFLPTESMLFLKCINPLTMAMIFEPGNSFSSVVSCLLKHGAHADAQRLYEFPPIIPALEGRKIQLAKMLIKAGASVNLYHPKLQGNFAVLLCLHQWKSLNLLLKVGAEVESLFDKTKYYSELERTLEHFRKNKGGKRECQSSQSERYSDNLSPPESDEQCTVDLGKDPETLDEESQIKVLQHTSVIPFHTFLVAARHVMSAGPYKVSINTVLYKMLYFAANVSIEGNLWSFLESKQDMLNLKKLTDTPRTLAHLCRLSVRKYLGSVQLINEYETRDKLHLPKNIWDFIFFHEVDD